MRLPDAPRRWVSRLGREGGRGSSRRKALGLADRLKPVRLPSDTSSVSRLTSVLMVVAVLAVAGGVSVVVLGATASAQSRSSRDVKGTPTLEGRVVDAINDVRRRHGLLPLRVSRNLAFTARDHSLSMAERGYFSHSSASGGSFWSRLKADRCWSVGENLAWGSPSLSASLTLELWLKSPAHRRNLLNPAWREIGVGGASLNPAPGVFEGRSTTIVTADFGVRCK